MGLTAVTFLESLPLTQIMVTGLGAGLVILNEMWTGEDADKLLLPSVFAVKLQVPGFKKKIQIPPPQTHVASEMALTCIGKEPADHTRVERPTFPWLKEKVASISRDSTESGVGVGVITPDQT
jgi:hypothetical protein